MYKGGCDTLLLKNESVQRSVSVNLRPVPVSSDTNRKPTASRRQRDAVVVRTYVNTVPKSIYLYLTYSYIFYITKHRIYGDQATTYQAGDTEILIVAAEYSSSAAIVNLASNWQPPATNILYQY